MSKLPTSQQPTAKNARAMRKQLARFAEHSIKPLRKRATAAERAQRIAEEDELNLIFESLTSDVSHQDVNGGLDRLRTLSRLVVNSVLVRLLEAAMGQEPAAQNAARAIRKLGRPAVEFLIGTAFASESRDVKFKAVELARSFSRDRQANINDRMHCELLLHYLYSITALGPLRDAIVGNDPISSAIHGLLLVVQA